VSQTNRRQFAILPLAGAHPEIGRWLWVLEDTRALTHEVLDGLDPEALDWLPAWALHSIGTLLYHIALVEVDWLYVEVLGHSYDQPYPGEMAALFPYPMRITNALTPIRGIPIEEHLQRLATARRALLDTYSAMSLEDFRLTRALTNADVSPEWVLHHLCQHEAEHRSEISALRTQFALQ